MSWTQEAPSRMGSYWYAETEDDKPQKYFVSSEKEPYFDRPRWYAKIDNDVPRLVSHMPGWWRPASEGHSFEDVWLRTPQEIKDIMDRLLENIQDYGGMKYAIDADCRAGIDIYQISILDQHGNRLSPILWVENLPGMSFRFASLAGPHKRVFQDYDELSEALEIHIIDVQLQEKIRELLP
jgi:hypothetical protein